MYDSQTTIDAFLNAAAAKQPAPGGGSAAALAGALAAAMGELVLATVRCAIYNVRANLPDVTDPRDRDKIEATTTHLLDRAVVLVRRVIPRIWSRHGKPA